MIQEWHACASMVNYWKTHKPVRFVCSHFLVWWDCLIHSGPEFSYYPNATKTCLIVKCQRLRKARALFRGTGVVVTDDGKRHLGSALGTDEFLIS